MKPKITREIEIEDLVTILPESVGYLRDQGIRCLRCGEPIWGTLAEAAEEKDFGNDEIDKFVTELNNMLNKK